MLKFSLFNQSHFFKIKIKGSDILNFSFFGGRVYTKMYDCVFTGKEVKNFDLLPT